MTKDFIQLYKIRDLGDLFNDTFSFIRSQFKPLMIGVSLVAGIPYLLLGIPQVMILGDMTGLMEGIGSGTIPESFWLFVPIVFLRTYFSILLVSYLYSYLRAYKESGDGIGLNNGVIIGTAFRKSFKSVLLTFVLSILIGLAFMFFIIPGIYLAVLFTFCLPALLIDDYSFSASFKRSSDLVTNNWWYTLLIVIILGIIVGILGSIVQIPLVGFSFLKGILDPVESSTLSGDFSWLWVGSVIADFLSAFFSIVLYLGIGIYYCSRAEEIDGSGLLQEIDTMGTQKDSSDTIEERY